MLSDDAASADDILLSKAAEGSAGVGCSDAPEFEPGGPSTEIWPDAGSR